MAIDNRLPLRVFLGPESSGPGALQPRESDGHNTLYALLGPVIYLSSVEHAALTQRLASLQSGAMLERYDLLMVGSVLSVLPSLGLLIVGQQWSVKSVATTEAKQLAP
jgi:hypothetical protein